MKSRVVKYDKHSQRVYIGFTAWRDAGIDPEDVDKVEIASHEGHLIIRPIKEEE